MNSRTSLVVGASTGIGAELVRQLCARGDRVVGVARRQERLEQLAEELGESFWPCVGDTSSEADVTTISQQMRERGWVPDQVYLNAGTAVSELPDFRLDRHREIFEVNYFGLLRWVEVWLPDFLARRSGVFVGTSSLMGYRAFSTDAVSYCSTKAALSNAFEGMRHYHHMDGVRFVTVHPGPVDTDMLQVPHKLPWTWTAERAARKIIRGVERGRVEINFPLPYAIVVRLTMWAPTRLLFWMLRRRPEKA